ncbi:MAG: homoserine kinase [Candidatus Tectimicrobiota bacterium]|nr:MAG: homoserine kinase [Candidatus Tectomicrobia bacterium]
MEAGRAGQALRYRRVQVRVPATTANLGSGFDVLGLALQLYNTFTLTVTAEPGWRVEGPPGLAVPRDDRNLFYHAARRLFSRLGVVPEGLRLALQVDIPLARGLGSSASAIVGGLLAANALLGQPLPAAALLALAVELEGHPDNVTPALVGGLTLAYRIDSEPRYLSLPFPHELSLLLAIPELEVPTHQARAVLPAQVSRADAVFNCSRTALWVYALQNRRYDLLAVAMEDRLHQPYRTALVPALPEALAAGYRAGALGVALSGAGPTVVAITQGAEAAVAAALQEAFARHGLACQVRCVRADNQGATVLGVDP